jgi:hypothetical protein
MRLQFRLPALALTLTTCALLHAQTAPKQPVPPSPPTPVSTYTPSTTPISPARAAKIEEMLTVTGTKPGLMKTIEQGRERVGIYAEQQADILPPSPKDKEAKRKEITTAYEAQMTVIAEKHLTWDKLKPTLIRYCADTFTDQQMDRIIAFYKSEAGKLMLEKGPDLNQQTYSALMSVQNQAKPLTEEATKDMQAKMGALGLLHPAPIPKSCAAHASTAGSAPTAK